MTSIPDLVERALTLDKYAVSRLIGIFEDRRPDASARRSSVLAELDTRRPDRPLGVILGVTGTPGSGKSSLLSRVAVDLLGSSETLSIAVVAVDPSSQVSGGALLGDRTRMRFVPDERRLFFRSQASDNDLGGLGPTSFQVCRLLVRLFDCVFIETVGIGQSEADIRQLADRVYLVLQPLGGDEVQFLKAGIIEIPDAFVLNKSDEPASDISFHQLQGSMWLARPFDAEFPPVFRTSALTGDGLGELEADMLGALAAAVDSTASAGAAVVAQNLSTREPYFLERWVDDEWGRRGVAFLHDLLGGPDEFLSTVGGFDAALDRFDETFAESLSL
ncbi:MAG: hypothetical protein R2735_15445 [Microthrixaceae bacterium]